MSKFSDTTRFVISFMSDVILPDRDGKLFYDLLGKKILALLPSRHHLPVALLVPRYKLGGIISRALSKSVCMYLYIYLL